MNTQNHNQRSRAKVSTLVLTGATGFLGSNLLGKLIDKDFNIIILKRSFSNTCRIAKYLEKIKYYDLNTTKIEQVFLENKIDIVVHCATLYGRRDVSPTTLLESNLILPLELLVQGVKHKISCFINTDTILDKRVNAYSLSKDQFKEWFRSYAQEMTCINIALEHFYGPYDDKTKFVSYIIDAILNNLDSIDLTEGKQKRDFIYIDDVIDAFLLLLDRYKSLGKGFLNCELGTNRLITIKKFVTIVKKLTQNDHTVLNFGAIPYRENEIMEYKVDTSEVRKLGWKPKTSLEDGLLQTIKREMERIQS